MAASRPASDVVAAARLVVVVMGVSGTGKSTVAEGIASALGLRCIDGDHLHSAASVAKMSRGVALGDEDRWPWLDRVGAALADAQASPAGMVVSCSALRRVYRDRLRAACPGLRFLFLDGDAELIGARLRQRAGHYMPASLFDSQLHSLERPDSDEHDVLRADVSVAADQVIAHAVAALRRGGTAPAA